ncbi:MAG: metallophosphatase family protein [wastewater metagenome]|nr:metallophosphatase family protein [Candidatus Loosdrechtia aerotolerans]
MIKINLIIHKLSSLWKSILLVLILIFFGFEMYTMFIQNYEGNIDLPQLTGNFTQVREMLAKEQQKDEFCFAIIGDTQSHGTFEQIARELRSESLSFAVFLGDFVRKGTEGNHNYFKSEYATEFTFPFPAFFVVGNHDVDMDSFPLSRFEEVYGPSIFSFEYQKCLFVVLRTLNEPYSNEESLQ